MLILPLGLAWRPESAIPGTVNYVEGQVSVAGQPVTPRRLVRFNWQPNQVLETGPGPGGNAAHSRAFFSGWATTARFD
jgi:hypothetical protein